MRADLLVRRKALRERCLDLERQLARCERQLEDINEELASELHDYVRDRHGNRITRI